MGRGWNRLHTEFIPLTVFAILGLGFVLLFAGVNWFWMVWVLGFAVVLPVIAILIGDADETEPETVDATNEREDPLQTLRDRYARGELTDEQFERKLDRLLETETPESSEEWIRDRSRAPERER